MPGDQRPDRIGGLRALADPVVHALAVDGHDRRLAARVVVAENFDEAAIAGSAGVGYDDAEIRTFLGPGPTQTNDDHHALLIRLRARPESKFRYARFRAPAYRRLRSISIARRR